MSAFKQLFDCTRDAIEYYECRKCTFKSKFIIHLRNHQEEDHLLDEPPSYKCPDCNFFTSSQYLRLIHVIQNHCSSGEFVHWHYCKLCEYKTKRKHNLQRHMVIHINSKNDLNRFKNTLMLNCEFCSYSTKRQYHLKRHQLAKHLHLINESKLDPKDYIRINKEIWYQCKLCEYKSRRKYDLNRHIYKLHSDLKCKIPQKTKLFRCKHCLYQTIRKYDLTRHRIAKHSDQDNRKDIPYYDCEYCSYRSKRKRDTQRHRIVKHFQNVEWLESENLLSEDSNQDNSNSPDVQQDMPFVNFSWLCCEFCPYKTIDKCALKRHRIRKHTSENFPWLNCELCSYSSKLKENLQRHIMNNHGDPADITWYECAQCPYKTKRRRCLRYHESEKHSN